MTITDLQPQRLWKEFDAITRIPRPSKKEGKIIAYLQEFGKKHNLETRTDAAGNVLICKPATKGYEDKPTVILQSHMDMVCEKNNDTVHDFENDPIQTYVDGEWLKAKGTTLGADNGIGMAAELAILASDDLKHPALECLFTVDEETGLTGAFAIDPNLLKGQLLINLDSEDDGQFFIGCAGGIDTTVTFTYKKEEMPEGVEEAVYETADMVVKKVEGHNRSVVKHNRTIVIFTIIEVATMILIFIFQSVYIFQLNQKILDYLFHNKDLLIPFNKNHKNKHIY